MKRILVILLALIMTISLFACGKNSEVESQSDTPVEEDKVEVPNSEQQEEQPVIEEKSNFLAENIDMEQAIETAGGELWTQKWYMDDSVPKDSTIEIPTEKNIVLSGVNAERLPVINNNVPFESIISLCEGRWIYYTLTATQYFATEIGETITAPAGLSEYEVGLLRQSDTGLLYDVKKYNNGGYVYTFYDREYSLEKGEYVTDDPTVVYNIGGVYMENVLSSKDFKKLRVGDSIEKVESIDSAVSFYRLFFAGKSEETDFFGEYAYEKTASLHLLTDGLLTVHYELVDNEYIVTDMVFSEDFIYDSPYIKEKYGHSYLKQFKILPQDYPPAS